MAARFGLGALDLVLRLQHKFFLPYRSAYSAGPGGELSVRWRRWLRLHPFASFFAEYLDGAGESPSAYLVRGLLGVLVVSRAGDLCLYLSADVGHRKGLAVLREERSLGFGVRFAFF